MKKRNIPKVRLDDVLFDIKVNNNARAVSALLKTDEVKQLFKKWISAYGVDSRVTLRNVMYHFVLAVFQYEEDYAVEQFCHYVNKYVRHFMSGYNVDFD